MKQIDFDKLEQDIIAQNDAGVSEALNSFFDSELTPEERGEILLNFALVYARMKNRLNAEYLRSLSETLEDLKAIDRMEREGADEADVEAIRNKIRDL